jgi:metallo-beta-lactamase class B
VAMCRLFDGAPPRLEYCLEYFHASRALSVAGTSGGRWSILGAMFCKASIVRLLIAFLASAGSLLAAPPDWTKPFPPHRIIGNLYYVGSKDLASYLITTPQGDILINSSFEENVPLIQASIKKLGFRFGDVKILLISHAHGDHCAGSALVKKLTGAKYMVMEGDVPVVESGGKEDFNYGKSSDQWYPPAKVDRGLHDGDQVKLGNIILTAHLTPGHTKGCTTWTMEVAEGGRTYHVVIVGSPNVNSGYKLVNNVNYPQIAQDYERTFRILKALPCDIFLGAHGEYYGMEAKYARLQQERPNPFIDPDGYKSFVAEKEHAFETKLHEQSQANH